MCTDLSHCPLLSHIRVPTQSSLPPPFPMHHCKPPSWSPRVHSLPIPDQPRSTLTDFPSPSPAKDFYSSAQRALLWLPFKVTDGEHTFTKIYRCLSLSITSCMPVCFFSLECSPLQCHLPKLLLSSSTLTWPAWLDLFPNTLHQMPCLTLAQLLGALGSPCHRPFSALYQHTACAPFLSPAPSSFPHHSKRHHLPQSRPETLDNSRCFPLFHQAPGSSKICLRGSPRICPHWSSSLALC